MGRLGRPLGSLALAALLLWTSPSLGQQIGPDDPLPPGAHGEVYPLKAEVFTIKPEILELRGLGSAMKARVEDVQGALKDLGAKVTGREIKINLAADVLFDFDKADLRAEAAPARRSAHACPPPRRPSPMERRSAARRRTPIWQGRPLRADARRHPPRARATDRLPG